MNFLRNLLPNNHQLPFINLHNNILQQQHNLEERLAKKKAENTFRFLPKNDQHLIDFCSNDYLGLARSKELQQSIAQQNFTYLGATGSRLISGNHSLFEEVEEQVAKFHKAESGLIFNSGYDANIGLLSSIASRHDTIIYDELSHASIRDGIRLSNARSFAFRHNDIEHLSEKLKKARGQIYLIVESIYSMDGDEAPLREILAVAKNTKAALIVDEAHATGVFGENGEGLCVEKGIEKDVFARICTFGKALGGHGAIVLGSAVLRDYLINFARSFIYTTAMPIHSLQHIKCAYFLLKRVSLQEKLLANIDFFVKNIKNKPLRIIPSRSPIQCIIIKGNEAVKKCANFIQVAGYDVRPILHPTVPKGEERLRICLHAFNTEKEILGLIEAIKNAMEKL